MEYMGMEDGADFKQEGRGGRAGRELSSARLRQRPVAMDTATDPYQQLSKIGLDARDLLDRCTGIWEN
jgi:hypothetical protein